MLEGEEGEKEGEGEGHVGGQERTKHFSPPGTKLHFRVNSSKKICRFGLVTWLQTKNTHICIIQCWIRGCSFCK